MDLDLRHLGDPQHVVAVEVGLDDPALVQREGTFEDRTQAETVPPCIWAW